MIYRADYEREKELRIKAEAQLLGFSERLADAQLQCAEWKAMYQALKLEQDQERSRHENEVKLLTEELDSVEERVAASAGPAPLLSADEILAEPAITKRGMRLRAIRAEQAALRETREKADGAFQKQQALLTDEEKRITSPKFDYMLGIYKDETTDADNRPTAAG